MTTLPKLLAVLFLASFFTSCAAAAPFNGFNLDDSLIPKEKVHLGGPPRDGIPAIDEPKFLQPKEVQFLTPDSQVLGLYHQGEARAYPIAIMNWHEIVNDQFGKEKVAVTFCPLCGSGIAFVASSDGRQLEFGVSGLLYNSDVLLYDRQTESLWSQLMGKAISGPLQGRMIDMLPLVHTTWSDWLATYPQSRVLSTETGYRRDYTKNPYMGYENEAGLYFPVDKLDKRYHPKERVLGVSIDGRHKAYPFSELSKTSGEIRDRLSGREVIIRFSAKSQSARAEYADKSQPMCVTVFWFAWYAFHPDTEVFRVSN